jgi:PAS domain S-box-containing protein
MNEVDLVRPTSHLAGDRKGTTSELSKMVVEDLPLMVCRFNEDGRCDYVNAAWSQFTGSKLEQASGDQWADKIHPDDRGLCVGLFFQHLEQRRPLAVQFRLRREDGTYANVAYIGAPYYDQTGRFAGFVGSCVGTASVPKREEEERARSLARRFNAPLLGIAECIHQLAYELAHGRRSKYETLRQLAECLDRISSVVAEVTGFNIAFQPAALHDA